MTCASLLLVACLLLPAAPAQAGPVLPEPVTLAQPDGTPVDAVPYGDEWENGYETPAGYTIVQDPATGVWSYATKGGDGALAPSALMPGGDPPDGLARHVRPQSGVPPNRFAIRPSPGVAPAATGTQAVLVLLVSFSNQDPVGSTAAQWSEQFFGASHSAKDYYREVSYNQLSLIPATESHSAANDGVVGWLNLGYPHPNTKGSTGSANRQITRDGIIAADPYIDFSSYDANHDGYIAGSELHIVVIVAGYETSYGGAGSACSPSVWGHQWFLQSGEAPTLDGVVVGMQPGGYTQFGEWHCSLFERPGHMATMGIMVHEMGHDINWPDLYDIDSSSYGVGVWSIMGYGSWGTVPGSYKGALPSQPDAFLKWYQGWLQPEQIIGSEPGVQLQQVETNQSAILALDNPASVDWAFGSRSGAGEYFLLENRQQVGYDAGLPGCGILIWHIDETRTSSNSANANDLRRLVDLEEADGRNDINRKANQVDAGDPYPGSAQKTVFDTTSNPNSKLYSGASSGVSVANFSACASAMSADISAPSATGPTRTPTATPTATASPTPRPTRTPGGAWYSLFWPVILKNEPPPTATPTATATPTPPTTGWVNILSEDFEGAWPGPWQLSDSISSNGIAYWGQRSCRAYQGTYSGWAIGGGPQGSLLPCGSGYPSPSSSDMVYGPFSLVGAVKADWSLKYWLDASDPYGSDFATFSVSKNGVDYYGLSVGSGRMWLDWRMDLSNVLGMGNLLGEPQLWILLRFAADETSGTGESAYVDNIVLRKCIGEPCPAD